VFVYHVTATRSLRVDYGVLIPATTSAAVLSRESNARRRQLPETFGRLPERERHQHVHKPDGVHHSVFERVNTRDVKTTQSNVTADTLDWTTGRRTFVSAYALNVRNYRLIFRQFFRFDLPAHFISRQSTTSKRSLLFYFQRPNLEQFISYSNTLGKYKCV